ncbi:MAG: hypothetical protein WCF23_21755 [Candidatus Nitrosopolaris sp.]
MWCQQTPLSEFGRKKIKLNGDKVIDGIPSLGLANAIATECCVHSLMTELVAVLDSPGFPSLSIIQSRPLKDVVED